MRFAPVDGALFHRHVGQRRVQARERQARIIEVHVRVIQGAAVVRAQDEEADHFGIELLQHFADGEEVAERLGHFFIVQAHETVMYPVIDAGMAERAFGLGDLVFVVRELQVRATAVDVELFTEQGARHGRALDMPARAALAPLRIPFDFFRLGLFRRLPQHEVERIALARVHVDALARAQVVERLARQLAVVGEVAHGVIDVAVKALVSQVLRFELFDQAQHLRHVFGGARRVVGRQNAQRGRVFIHVLRETRRQLGNRLAVFHGAADDLVVDVRNVAHIGDVETGGFQPAVDDVERHHHARMADMAIIVDGHAADVHAYLARFHRDEYLLLASQGVVNL